MIRFLQNARGHANPLSIALNIATVVLGLTILFFEPKFLPVNGIVFFAAYMIVVQIIHISIFGSNPVSMILVGIVIVGSAIVMKLGLGSGNYVTDNRELIIISLIVVYLLREVID